MLTNYICQECGSILTAEEQYYYEYRCEGCETEWHERLEAYRKGADDPELEELFAAPRTYSVN